LKGEAMNKARRRLLQRGLFLGCGAGGLLASLAAFSGWGGGDADGDLAARFDGSAAAPAADSSSHPAADAGVPRRRALQMPPPGAIDVRAAPFNARGDGMTDDTAALQAAIDAGRPVFLRGGTYAVTRLRLRAGLLLVGDGHATLAQRGTGSMLGALSAGPAEQLDGITLQDLTLQGQVESHGFAEHVHLLDLRGVRNARLQRCVLRGFRGDGLVLGGQAADGTARHNTNVLVIENEFDGISGDNRNGISVIDGDGIVIQRNLFQRCTRANMPGAIDVEPNAQPFHVVRNIFISSNRLRDIGGSVGAIAIVPARHRYDTPPSNFLVAHNIVDGCRAFAIAFVRMREPAGGLDTLTHELRVRGNSIVGARRGVGLTGVAGAVIENNRISDREGSMVGHVEPDQRADDVTVRGNHFERCGSGSGVGLSVHEARRLLLQDNHFDDCGHGGPGSHALDFRAGSSDGVALVGNRFSAAGGRTRVAIQREANHRWTPSRNRFDGNELNGLPNRFEWG
jgi:hypothetical protein